MFARKAKDGRQWRTQTHGSGFARDARRGYCSKMPGKRNDDRDERVTMHGADPEAVLRALLQVDPDSDPVDDGEDDVPDDKVHNGA